MSMERKTRQEVSSATSFKNGIGCVVYTALPIATTQAAFLPVQASKEAFQASHKPHPNADDPVFLCEITYIIVYW